MHKATAVEEKWRDVVKLIEQWKDGATLMNETMQRNKDDKRKMSGTKAVAPKVVANVRRRSVIFADRPVYGAPMHVPGLAYEPVNEMGVVLLFGIMARRLGFHVERVQPDFPDCEAMREMQPGKWQRVRIEFEYESRNFKIHRHPADKCDVIVCWRHNWTECPRRLEVVELRAAFSTQHSAFSQKVHHGGAETRRKSRDRVI